jgi:hypothetical protein
MTRSQYAIHRIYIMMSTDNRIASSQSNPEETFQDFLTYAELLNTPQLARLYIFALREGPVEIELIKILSLISSTMILRYTNLNIYLVLVKYTEAPQAGI